MIKHLNLKISGEVQGVNFRNDAKYQAENLGITGFARNEAGGSVYIEAEGEEENLRQFVDWCRVGNEYAKVEKVEIKEGETNNFGNFIIQ